MNLSTGLVAVLAFSSFASIAAAADAPPIAAATCLWGQPDCNRCTPNAEQAVGRLRSHGDALGFHMNGAPDVTLFNHWEGIQRLMSGGGRYLAVSRALEAESQDVSFAIVEMASRNDQGERFRSNRLDPDWFVSFTAPPASDRIVLTMPHESGFKHAGGMQALGDILAVPFENDEQSKVVFYDLANPLRPVRLGNEVDHSPLSHEAGTATLGKLANGHFLLIVGRAAANILDFYVSTGTDLKTTGFDHFDTWFETELTGNDSEFGDYQNLNFVAQCDGRLFMVGTHRNAAATLGDDFIDLFEVTNGAGNDVAITKLAKKHLICDNNTCNFDAAGGAYVDPGGELYVYGTTHDNDGVPSNGFGFPFQCAGAICSTSVAEFRPVPHDRCEGIEEAWVELYDDTDFGDRSLMIDFVDRTLEDYTNFDRAEAFEDKTSSLRYCIPEGATFRLWEDKNSCGGDHLDLVGDGRFHSVSSLGGFGDETSCAEWRGGPFARAGADRTAECTGSTTPVRLDGRASISLEGGTPTFTWQAAGVIFDDSTSATPIGNFSLAPTAVTLTFTDSVGTDGDTVNVTIVDTIAPTITCPANVVVGATAPTGAIVSYAAPNAADSCGVQRVTCAAPSDSTFAIGTSAVQCTVADFANHTASCGFTVHVKGAEEQTSDLIAQVGSLSIKSSTRNALLVKLNSALTKLQSGSNISGVCGALSDFIGLVKAQSGKEIPVATADALVAAAVQIRSVVGCQ